jgi:uncharacterized protein (TIGR02598 family)
MKVKRPNDSTAFSLVESVIALGVTSFVIISLLGLLTAGLTTAHKALNTSAQTQIIQDLVNNISQATNLDSYTSETYNYDYEGNPTNAASIYQVSVTKGSVVAPAALSGAPGSTLTSAGSTFVIRITSAQNNLAETNSILIPTPPSKPGS